MRILYPYAFVYPQTLPVYTCSLMILFVLCCFMFFLFTFSASSSSFLLHDMSFWRLWSFHLVNWLLLHSLSFSLQGQRSGAGEGTGVSVLNGEPGDSLPELGIKLLPCGERRRHRRVTQTLINEQILLWTEKLSWNNYKLLDMHKHMLGISETVKRSPKHMWAKK